MLNPFPAGDGRPWPNQAFTTDSGIFTLVGVPNSALALHMETPALYVCTGAWTIQDDGSAGKATFTPSVADVTTGPLGKPGVYQVYPVVTLTTGPVSMDSQILHVVALP